MPCVLIAPVDVRLPKGDESDQAVDTVVQPDVLVVCDKRKLAERGCTWTPTGSSRCSLPRTSAHDQVTK